MVVVVIMVIVVVVMHGQKLWPAVTWPAHHKQYDTEYTQCV